MPPTIRIDDEVYAWLQEQARPFEDTPNSVLRRVACLDTTPTQVTAMPTEEEKTMHTTPQQASYQKQVRLSGKMLNEKWKVGAKHALYHREGCWYNNLEHFPGALFDPNGYVIFKTREEYQKSRHLRVTQETNIPNGISSIPGYVRMN